jgi:hypothetical protein
VAPSLPVKLDLEIKAGEHKVEIELLSSLVGSIAVYFEYQPRPEAEKIAADITHAKPAAKVEKEEAPDVQIRKMKMTPSFSAQAAGREDIGFAPKVGAILIAGKVFSPLVAVGLRNYFPKPLNHMWAEVEGGYYSPSIKREEVAQHTEVAALYDATWTIDVYRFVFNLAYEFPLGSSVWLYTGAGAGFCMANIKYKYDIKPGDKVSATPFMAEGMVGTEIKAGPGRIMAEFKGSTSTFPSKEGIESGEIGGTSMLTGYRFTF